MWKKSQEKIQITCAIKDKSNFLLNLLTYISFTSKQILKGWLNAYFMKRFLLSLNSLGVFMISPHLIPLTPRPSFLKPISDCVIEFHPHLLDVFTLVFLLGTQPSFSDSDCIQYILQWQTQVPLSTVTQIFTFHQNS